MDDLREKIARVILITAVVLTCRVLGTLGPRKRGHGQSPPPPFSLRPGAASLFRWRPALSNPYYNES